MLNAYKQIGNINCKREQRDYKSYYASGQSLRVLTLYIVFLLKIVFFHKSAPLEAVKIHG